MRFILFAAFLAVMAKSKPVLRHLKNDALRYESLGTQEECTEYFSELDADNSGYITMEDINAISARPDAAHLIDVFFATLFATGRTSFQGEFSVDEATFVLYCTDAYYRDMSSAVAKRVEVLAEMKHKHNLEEMKQKAEAKTAKGAALKEKLVIHIHDNNNNNKLQTPSCYAECPEGEYCGSGGCTANGSCGTVEDCSNTDNLYAAAACVGTLECNAGTCAMKCGESPPDPTLPAPLPAPAQIENRAALKEKLASHITNNKPQTSEVQQEHTKNLSHHKQPSQLSATCEDFLDYWYSTYFFEPYCEECLEGGCVFANGRCANECMADASCFTSYCPMPDDCHSCLDRGYVWTAGECSEQCMADASCYTSILDCP